MSGESNTVLVLEPDAASRDRIVDALAEEGYEVVATDDGLEAIEQCELRRIDVGVLSWDSMQLDAFEVACRIRSQAHYGPVVFLSDDERPATMHGYVHSADGVLTRPVDIEELRLHLRTLSVAKRNFDRLEASEEDELVTVTESLPGLYNRRYLSRRLYDELERCERRGAPISVLVIDLDDFKRVNIARGYRTGDELLKQATDLFRSRLRSTDTVCRYGGEEFVALLPLVDGVSASLVAERVREEVQVHTFEVSDSEDATREGVVLKLTVSIGVADSREAGYNADTLLRVADESAIIAKLSGKNRVVLGGR